MRYGTNLSRTAATMLQKTRGRKKTGAVRCGGNDFLQVRGSKAL